MAFAENHYIPLLYNLSTMFDFNPVKGTVKSLDTDVQENGKITYKISIRLNKNGCVDSLNLGNDSNLLIVFYVQIMPDDFVMQLHR
ncbi:YnfC family lipoprotein, partial [Enterobacter roggenkampii]